MQAHCTVCGAVGGFWFQYILQTFEWISKANNSQLKKPTPHFKEAVYIKKKAVLLKKYLSV